MKDQLVDTEEFADFSKFDIGHFYQFIDVCVS